MVARHPGRDSRTIKARLDGDRAAGVRRAVVPDVFERFVEWCCRRLSDDPHVWASTLFDEGVALGYQGEGANGVVLVAADVPPVSRHGGNPACTVTGAWRLCVEGVWAINDQNSQSSTANTRTDAF